MNTSSSDTLLYISLSGQMGQSQHLGFDGTRVTDGSGACARKGDPHCPPPPNVVKTVAAAATDLRYDKYSAPQMQTFQIPFAGVRIRSTYVENWRKNTTAESRWEKAWQVAWLIHWEHAGSARNNTGKNCPLWHPLICTQYGEKRGEKNKFKYKKAETRLQNSLIPRSPETHRVRFSWQSLTECLRSGGFT